MTKLRPGQRVLANGSTGIIRFVGCTDFAPGEWVGVELDAAVGKNDGSIQGKRYFVCKDMHGVFVRASRVALDTLHRNSTTGLVSTRHRSPEPVLRVSSHDQKDQSGDRARSAARAQASSVEAQEHQTNRIRAPVAAPKSVMGYSKALEDDLMQHSAAPTGSVSPIESTSMEFTGDPPTSDSRSAHDMNISATLAGQSIAAEIRVCKAEIASLQVQRREDVRKLSQLSALESEKLAWTTIRNKLREKLQAQQAEIKMLTEQLASVHVALKNRSQTQDDGYSQALEMAALDREMAEEERDQLRIQLDDIKAKMESMSLEIEIMKAQEDSPTMTDNASNLQDLAAQNGRLREALVRLKAITVEQDGQLKSANEEAEASSREVSHLQERINSLTSMLSQKDAVLEDLRAQVDISSAAEEMLESLTERNLLLGEDLERCRATIADLESMQEISNELEETRVQNEKDLLEDLRKAELILTDHKRTIELNEGTIAEYSITIRRFRDLVASLQKEILQVQSENHGTQDEDQTILRNAIHALPEATARQARHTQEKQKGLFQSLLNTAVRRAKLHIDTLGEHIANLNTADKDLLLAIVALGDMASTSCLLVEHTDILSVAEADYIAWQFKLEISVMACRTSLLEFMLEHISSVEVDGFCHVAARCASLNTRHSSLAQSIAQSGILDRDTVQNVNGLQDHLDELLAVSELQKRSENGSSIIRCLGQVLLLTTDLLLEISNYSGLSLPSAMLMSVKEHATNISNIADVKFTVAFVQDGRTLEEDFLNFVRHDVLKPGEQTPYLTDRLTELHSSLCDFHESLTIQMSGQDEIQQPTRWSVKISERLIPLDHNVLSESMIEKLEQDSLNMHTQLQLKSKELDEEQVRSQSLVKRLAEQTKTISRVKDLEMSNHRAKAERTMYEEAIDDLNAQMQDMKIRYSREEFPTKAVAGQEVAHEAEISALRETIRYMTRQHSRLQRSHMSECNEFLLHPLAPKDTTEENDVNDAVRVRESTLMSIRHFIYSAQLIDFRRVRPAALEWRPRHLQNGWIHYKQEEEFAKLSLTSRGNSLWI